MTQAPDAAMIYPPFHTWPRTLHPISTVAALCALVSCSSAPIPSFDERQPDDIEQTKAAQQAAVTRTSAPTAPSATAKAATKPAANASTIDAGESDEHAIADAGLPTGDAGVRDFEDGGDAGSDASSPDAGLSQTNDVDGRALGGDAGLEANTYESSSNVTSETSSDSTFEEFLPFSETICGATFLDELHYAEGNEFWLGDQSESLLRVDGLGYFAAQGPDGASPPRRYARSLALSVSPDGTLVDHAGYAVLGYSPHPEDPCLTTLRAPLSLAARPTTSIGLTVNLSSQSVYSYEPFDVSKPAATAIAAPISVPIVDVDGRNRSLTTYFESTGTGSFRYHVLAPQGELVPGATGFEEVGFGDLQFDIDGALLTETSPLLCITYANSTGYQCFTFDFGSAIVDDGQTTSESSTSLDAPTALAKVSNDGYVAGTSFKLAVDAKGAVSVILDNGQTRTIGTLAFARFPSEAGLAAIDGTTFAQTMKSGMPAFGPPLSAGRGSVLH